MRYLGRIFLFNASQNGKTQATAAFCKNQRPYRMFFSKLKRAADFCSCTPFEAVIAMTIKAIPSPETATKQIKHPKKGTEGVPLPENHETLIKRDAPYLASRLSKLSIPKKGSGSLPESDKAAMAVPYTASRRGGYGSTKETKDSIKKGRPRIPALGIRRWDRLHKLHTLKKSTLGLLI